MENVQETLHDNLDPAISGTSPVPDLAPDPTLAEAVSREPEAESRPDPGVTKMQTITGGIVTIGMEYPLTWKCDRETIFADVQSICQVVAVEIRGQRYDKREDWENRRLYMNDDVKVILKNNSGKMTTAQAMLWLSVPLAAGQAGESASGGSSPTVSKLSPAKVAAAMPRPAPQAPRPMFAQNPLSQSPRPVVTPPMKIMPNYAYSRNGNAPSISSQSPNQLDPITFTLPRHKAELLVKLCRGTFINQTELNGIDQVIAKALKEGTP